MSAVRPHPPRTSALALALAALLAFALGGCGSGHSTTTSGPTRAQYVARANAICEAVRAKTTPLISELQSSVAGILTGEKTAETRDATVVAQLHTYASQSLAQLEALPQPAADHAAIERFLTPLEAVVTAIGHAHTSLVTGQAAQAVATVTQIQPTAQAVTSAAHAYGLTECASVLGALG